jgi:hypothetical protein
MKEIATLKEDVRVARLTKKFPGVEKRKLKQEF